MGYRVVDMSADPRCGQFAYFRRMTFPFAGITAEVDITDLMAARNGRPFFLSMLYAVTRAVNAVPSCAAASRRTVPWWSTTGAPRPTLP